MMEAARSSETLVDFYQTTRLHNPEDSQIRTRRSENLKSYKMWFSAVHIHLTNQFISILLSLYFSLLMNRFVL
jgi:hypothetical protein